MTAVAEREIESNGLSFEALVAGPEGGEVVLLLHGYPQSAASWRETMEWLARRGMRSIAPNLRGYSPNANPAEASAYRMDTLVEDVIGIAAAEGVERFHLVGHDWGGALAWALAAAHPSRLLSLTVISTPHTGAFLEALRSPTQKLRSSYMSLFRVPRVPEAFLNAANLGAAGLSMRLFGMPRASWQRDRQQLRRVGGFHGPLNWYRGVLGGGGSRPQRVTVPTMYLWGKRDPVFGRRAAELTAKWVTGPYRFEEMTAGHWIIDRNSFEMRRLLAEHLDANRAPAPAPEVPAAPARARARGPQRSAASRKAATAPKRATRPRRKPESGAG